TKIDLILDLVSQKALQRSKDPLYTFNFFVDWFKKNDKVTGLEKWNEIFLQYQRLRDWYADREIYHRLGYLVSINFPADTLARIFKFAHPEGKEARSTERIRKMLNRLIKYSLIIKPEGKFKDVADFKDLKYNCAEDPDNSFDASHHYMIKRYLTLYNVMVTEKAGKSLRYPFAYHNTVDGGWSLEHIHAQKSETLNKDWQWQQWVATHLESLNHLLKNQELDPDLKTRMSSLRERMEEFIKMGKGGEEFKNISQEFREIMENLPGATGLYQDEMANMALLGRYDNSTLNNSTFDVKRRKIISELSTNFVPIATERVFLKAIVNNNETCDTDHLFFWGDKDREVYMSDMEAKLKDYLSK
ncbi:MAG: hypothetical protein K2K55_01710, partial [Duncaniella sp.]|nr:hypothetical protein [Duncaniella sp.]